MEKLFSAAGALRVAVCAVAALSVACSNSKPTPAPEPGSAPAVASQNDPAVATNTGFTGQVVNPDFNGGLALPNDQGLIVFGSDGAILRSEDGLKWAPARTPTTADLVTAAARPDGSAIVVAGVAGTILRSSDHGLTWQSGSGDFASKDFKTVLWDEASGTWIAAGAHGLIARSKDGAAWTVVTSNVDLEFQSLFADAKTKQLFIGGENGAVGVSKNGGESWNLTMISMPDPATPIVGYARHAKLLLARSALGRFLTSEDDGQAWQLNQAAEKTFFTDSAQDARTGAIVMTGHDGSILHSGDGGKSWQPLSIPVEGRTQYMSAIRADSESGILTIVGHNGFVARSDNGGQGWISYTVGPFEMRGLVHDAKHKRYVTYGVGGLIVGSGDNGGEVWSAVREPLDIGLRDVAPAPRGGALVATGKLGVVLRSEDGGANWKQITPKYPNENTPPDLRMVTTSPSNDALIAVGPPGAILRSDPTGNTWEVAQWTPIEAERAFLWVLPDRQRARLTTVEARGQMRVSNEDGKKWDPRQAPNKENELAFWHAAQLERAGIVIASGKAGIGARSTDGGITWNAMATGTKEDLFGSFADDEAGLLFLFGEKGMLLRSSDRGQTWQPRVSGTDKQLRRMLRDPKTGALVCFGAWGSLLRSEDGGLTWTAIASGVDGELRKGIVDPRTGALLIAGSRGVVLRSTDAGRTWQVLPTHTKKHFYSLAVNGQGDIVAVGERIVRLVAESPR